MRIDLFGEEIVKQKKFPNSSIGRYMQRVHYRKAVDDERCKNCKWLICKGNDYNYYKCKLIGLSSSAATDVRLSYVCDKFGKSDS